MCTGYLKTLSQTVWTSNRFERALEAREWGRGKASALDLEVITTPGRAPYGLGAAIIFWERICDEGATTMASILKLNPYHFPVILSFTSDHELSRRFWDDIVLPLVYREENLRACKDHNLPEIRDRRYYEY